MNEIIKDLEARRDKLIAERAEFVQEAKEKMLKLQKISRQTSRRHILWFTVLFIVNAGMIVYYEQDRTILNVILQTVHFMGLFVLIKTSWTLFKLVREYNIKLKDQIKKLDCYGRDN